MNKTVFGDGFFQYFRYLSLSKISFLSRNGTLSSLTISVKLYRSFHLVIFRLVAATEGSLGWDILEVKRLLDHQDNILSLVNVNGKLIVSMFILCTIFYLLTCFEL